jgi:hypothetical protein
VSDVVEETTTTTVKYADIIKCALRFKTHKIPSGLAWPARHIPLRVDEAVGKTFQRGIVAVLIQVCECRCRTAAVSLT